MTRSRWTTRVVAVCLALAVTAGPLAAQQVPSAPNPVPVALTGASTAVLILDVVEPICNPQPTCIAMVPRIAALLAAARRAGALVIYSAAALRGLVAPIAQPPFLAAIAPAAGDTIVPGAAQDRVYASRRSTTHFGSTASRR
jgi:hypothetical protein